MSRILLILKCLGECVHDVQLFQRQDAKTFDQSSETIRRSASLAVVVRIKQQSQQITRQVSGIRFY